MSRIDGHGDLSVDEASITVRWGLLVGEFPELSEMCAVAGENIVACMDAIISKLWVGEEGANARPWTTDSLPGPPLTIRKSYNFVEDMKWTVKAL